jgi:hypothetical protein
VGPGEGRKFKNKAVKGGKSRRNVEKTLVRWSGADVCDYYFFQNAKRCGLPTF